MMPTLTCPRCHGDVPVSGGIVTAVLACPRCGYYFPTAGPPSETPGSPKVLYGEIISEPPGGVATGAGTAATQTVTAHAGGSKSLSVLALIAFLFTGAFMACFGVMAFTAVALVGLVKLAFGQKPVLNWQVKVERTTRVAGGGFTNQVSQEGAKQLPHVPDVLPGFRAPGSQEKLPDFGTDAGNRK